MIFRQIRLTDYTYFQNNSHIYPKYFGSELNFVNLYAWNDIDSIKICIRKNFILLRGIYNGEICFLPPLLRNEGSLSEAIELMESYCQKERVPLVINGLNEVLKGEISKRLSFDYITVEQPELFEYLHTPSDFFHYSGKKLHAKRNHLNKFIKSYSYIFRTYESTDLVQIMDLLELWNIDNGLPTLESQAIKRVLENINHLDAFCDVIVIEDKISAFSIGTISYHNMGIILFEKANTFYDGIYAALNCFVASKRYHNCQYINRQEDMGIEVLKKSKLSYRPTLFEKKYSIIKNDYFYQMKTQLRRLYEETFNDSPYYMNYFFSEKYHIDRAKIKVLDNDIVSALHIVYKTISYHKQMMHLPYIVAASTKVNYRRKGLMRELIHQTIHDLYQSGDTIVGLNPVDKLYYQQFGFVFWSFSKPTTISNTLLSNNNIHIEKVDMFHYNLLQQLYQTCSSSYDTYIERDKQYWKNYIREIIFDQGYLEIIYKDNIPYGYLVFVNDCIDELCVRSEDIIYSMPQYQGYPVLLPTNDINYPYNMIRIVNVKKLLLEYPYSSTINASIAIEIVDSFFEPNNIKMKLDIIQGVVQITDTTQVDIIVTIEDITKIIFTSYTAEHLLHLRSIFKSSNNLIFDKF